MRGMAQRELLRNFSIPLRVTVALFRRSERPVQARLATIGGVAMNDPVLRRFVDCRNCCVNLIRGALWR